MIQIFTNDKIEKLNMSVRLHNCLRRAGVDTVEKLLDFPAEKWSSVRNLGVKTIEEVVALVDSIKKGNGEYNLIDGVFKVEDSPIVDENAENTSSDAFEKSIDEMNLSVRAYNCLSKAGIVSMSQLVVMTREDLMNIRNMGINTVNEILEKVAEIEKDAVKQKAVQVDVPDEIWHIADECSESYGLSAFKLRNIFSTIYREFGSVGIESIVSKAYADEYLRTGAKNYIIKFSEKFRNEFDIELVREKLPDHLMNTLIAEDLLLELENENIIRCRNGVYTVCYPTVLEYIETLKDERSKNVVFARLQGRTLTDIGAEFNITRERTRQICFKAFHNRKKVRLEEDKYRYIFENYSLGCEDFCKITDEPITTFYYLDLVCDVRGKARDTVEKMLTDETLSIELKRRAEKVAYKDFIIFDGTRVRKNKAEIFKYIIKKYCKDKKQYSDIVKLYYECIEEKGLRYDPKLEIESRTYENKLQACNYVLWNFNYTMRYYDITERDYSRLVENLALDQYKDVSLSTLKLLREHAELMEEYDIRDEYELHNLLKKIWPEWGNCEIDFGKMPTLNFGNYDRDNQVIDLLLKYAPISNIDLAKKYEEMYGVVAATVMANYLNCIDSYFHNGVYSIEFESLTMEQSERMSFVLTDDFYSIDDFRRTLKREFPDAKETLVNSYNIKNLGFIFNDRYLIRKTYHSASEYFKFKLLEKDIVDTRDFPKAMLNSVSYSSEKYELRNNRVITEFSPGQYINISRLKNVGINESDLDEYCKEVRAFVPDDIFFTIKSIKQDGFDSTLHELYFEDWFYSSVLIEDREAFSYIRCGGTRVLYSGKKKFNLSDFIVWFVERETKIEIYDMEDIFRERYGLVMDRYKLTSLAVAAGLYYDEIMETIYIDYDTYFEEV